MVNFLTSNFQRYLLGISFIFISFSLFSQGITSANIEGYVKDNKGEALIGASVEAVHNPSNSTFGGITREDGSFFLPAVRIGGPYTIKATYIGYQAVILENVYLSLGQTFRANFILPEDGIQLEAVEVIAEKNALMNGNKNGASTNINERTISSMPTLSRSIGDFLRFTPQSRSSSVAATAGQGTSFAGQDSRFNNLTIDGSIFNNSFGLASGPGGQTNAAPISLDAIEEIQVNLAPFDVRQGGFTGAGVNAVTRSGTNQLHGSVFYNTRNENLTGSKAGDIKIEKSNFFVTQAGFRLGGPIIKNKLFFFANGEIERRTDPATSFRARRSASENPLDDPSLTRVLESDLNRVSRQVDSLYGYKTGAFQGYDLPTVSNKGLIKFDYNIKKGHRASLRLNFLTSSRDILVSNSGGFSGRRSNQFALNFENSNYKINNDIYSGIFELNSVFGKRVSNNFQFGYTANRDYRASFGNPFPLVDILSGGRNYITLGTEPFTPNNRLNTNTVQVKNDVSVYLKKNTITGGVNFEAFQFENIFTPTLYGQYVFNSVNDFIRATRGDSVGLRRYVQTYLGSQFNEAPVQLTRAYMPGAYIQDEISTLNDRLRITAGVRLDVPIFGNTALRNPIVDTMKFLVDGGLKSYGTDKLPSPQLMWSPRLGFNWDVKGNRTLQIRGGTGLFTGRPAFVWMSNQVGNNGLLTGQVFQDNTNSRRFPFNGRIDNNLPSNRNISSFNLALSEENFRFPQIWRSNIAVDYKLPLDIVASAEYIYNQKTNDINYSNINLENPSGNFKGVDNRPFFPATTLSGSTAQNNANRRYDQVTDAILLSNTNQGYSQSATIKLERPFKNNLFAMVAYNWAEAKDIVTAGSIAASSWRDNRSVNGNNNPPLTFSDFDQRHRIIAGLSYKLDYAKWTSTTLSMFVQSGNQGRSSLSFNGDYNGDQVVGNDLIFIPNKASDLTFGSLTRTGDFNFDGVQETVTITADQQRDAFQRLLDGDKYLSDNKGKYAQRNGILLPWLTTIDLTVTQDFHIKVNNENHNIQIRADFFNFGNLLNSDWGVGDFAAENQPLNPGTYNATTGIRAVTLGVIDDLGRWNFDNSAGKAPSQILRKSATLSDVWQAQIGLRYTF
jgi:hypothetical protein